MIKRDLLIEFIIGFFGKELLKIAAAKDELANGVQILGGEFVKKVALGVSLNEDFLSEAIQAGANFCIFHHGLDTKVYKDRYSLASQKRLRLIFNNNLTIAGFHYVLDAHPEIGNNATIIKNLGAQITDTLFDEWGYVAQFSKPQAVKDLAVGCSKLFEHDVFAVYCGPETVKTIGVVSGAGKPYVERLAELEAKRVELFLSGETSESIPNKMKESEINYFACGHYATEVFGVQELGKVIKSHFQDKLEVEFIDIPNPI